MNNKGSKAKVVDINEILLKKQQEQHRQEYEQDMGKIRNTILNLLNGYKIQNKY